MRQARDLVSQSVYVVTSAAGERTAGMTASWVARLSYRPALYGVAIYHASHTRQVAMAGKCFCINIPDDTQVDLARHFGFTSGRSEDKLEGRPWRRGASGAPILLEAAAYVDCRVVREIDMGDHTLFVGELVEEGVVREAEPLRYRPADYTRAGV